MKEKFLEYYTYKNGFYLALIIIFILVLIISFTNKDTIEIEKIKTEKVYVNEYNNIVDNPNISYWYYSYSTLNNIVGYGCSQSDTKFFNYDAVIRDTRLTLEKKYKKDFSFIIIENIAEISKKDYEIQK
jgi:hypothetical protein